VTVWCAGVALLLSACGADGGGYSDEDRATSSASCVLRVTIDGVDWWGIGMEHDLGRELRGPDIAAVQPGCDDVNPGQDPAADDGRPVVLRAIEGLPADEVLFLPGEDLDDQVFVPREVRSIHELPAAVQELVRRG
jgi:hypothetical protein